MPLDYFTSQSILLYAGTTSLLPSVPKELQSLWTRGQSAGKLIKRIQLYSTQPLETTCIITPEQHSDRFFNWLVG